MVICFLKLETTMREKERAKSGFYFSDMAICFCFIKLGNYNERERERGASLNTLDLQL